MSNTYFKLKKTVETKGFCKHDGYSTDYEATLTAFIGGENIVQLTIQTDSSLHNQNGIAYIVLSEDDIERLINALNERVIGKVSATGCEKSEFSNIDLD